MPISTRTQCMQKFQYKTIQSYGLKPNRTAVCMVSQNDMSKADNGRQVLPKKKNFLACPNYCVAIA